MKSSCRMYKWNLLLEPSQKGDKYALKCLMRPVCLLPAVKILETDKEH